VWDRIERSGWVEFAGEEAMEDKSTLEDALALMRDLRRRCEWDRAQTHESLRPYLIEEAHELDDALHLGEAARELGVGLVEGERRVHTGLAAQVDGGEEEVAQLRFQAALTFLGV
jgi:NTP pyrophosphatase (non-canonical NTP hydrolase)